MFTTKEEAIARIELIADTQRAKVVGDPVRAFEYQAAETAAKAFQAAGYSGPVPPEVSVWASAKGWSNTEACDDILTAAAQFRYALQYIRGVRLNAKYQLLDNSELTIEEINSIATEAINNLKGVGS